MRDFRADDCERAVIGSLLIEPERLGFVREILGAEMFLDTVLGAAFSAMIHMAEEKKQIDHVTIAERLREAGRESPLALLVTCLETVVTAAHARQYAVYVADRYWQRQIVAACREMATVQEPTLIQRITGHVLQRQALTAPRTFDYPRDLPRILADFDAGKEEPFFPTGFRRIDDSWHGGAKAGEITTWAAAPNVGKSAMLLNLQHHVATEKTPCLYVGTEMDAQETVERHLSIVSGVEAWKIRKRFIRGNDLARVHNAFADVMYTMPVSILDDPEPTLLDIESAAIASKARVLLLDYLERFNLPREESLRLRVKEFMRRLKTLARRRGLVVHLASQLNRDTYGKNFRRPTLADLSESSAIEKESDRVMLMWAPEDSQPADGVHLEIIQAKNRHGDKGGLFDFFLDKRTLEISECGSDGQRPQAQASFVD